MTRVIGLVCEGPRDVDLISSIIDNLYPNCQFEYRFLQPDVTLQSANYNGWKGVLRWCKKDYKSVSTSGEYLASGIDLIVVQIDGDVSRDSNNKQSHCNCAECECSERKSYKSDEWFQFEECQKSASKCPLPFPCPEHQEERPKAYVSHLERIVNTYLGDDRSIPVIIVIPCDSTDTWVVAAFEDMETEYELLEDPWNSIIAKGKEYHGIRIHGKKKSKLTYKELIKVVTANWPVVTSKCEQARYFQESITDAIGATRTQT